MEAFAQDLRHALRSLRRNPGFALAAVLTLALGIGATTALFAVLEAVVLTPLPYPAADRLVSIGNRVPRSEAEGRWGVSPVAYFYIREHSRTLEEVGVYRSYPATLTGEGGARRVQRAWVSAPLLGVLGARPIVGRLLTPEDDRPGAPPAALLGAALWSERFGRDPGVVGRTVTLDGEAVRVVGVLEPGVALPDPGPAAEVWTAERLDPAAPPANWHDFSAVGRLRPGQSAAGAGAELQRFTSRFTELFPSAYTPAFMEETGFRADVVPLRDQVVGETGTMLWVLFGAVGLVLLTACIDVSGLFLVRTEARRRELAIRAAVGATRGRLARQFLTEGPVLALLGGALGLLLAIAGVRALLAAAPERLPRMEEVSIGGEVVGFTLVLSLAVGVWVGAFPLLRFGGGASAEALRGAGRDAGSRRGRARDVLVVGQVAVALVLVVAAGLMTRSFQRLRAVDPGFDPAGVLTLELTLPPARYPRHADVAAFYHELATRAERLPGVRSAGLAAALPLAGEDLCGSLFVEDRPLRPGEEAECVPSLAVSPGYMATMGIPVRGRDPSWSDVERRSGEVVVSATLAKRLWPGENPIGKGVRARSWGRPFYRVAGVAGDVRAEGMDRPATAMVYFPLLPMLEAPLWSPRHSMALVVRSSAARPESLAPPLRRLVAEMDPDIPVTGVEMMEAVVARSMARTRFATLLLLVAAGVATVLGGVGVYGVLAQGVHQRRTEFGIRMALGARAGQVAALVMRRTLTLAAAGVAAGILAALAATRVLRSLLFDISPTDLGVMAAASLGLIVVALVAGYLPVRRATRADPMLALRQE